MKKYCVLGILNIVFFWGGAVFCFAENSVVDLISRPQIEYNSSNLRDPFKEELSQYTKPSEQPVEAKQENLPKMDVQGLIWGGNFPQAIINNKVLKIGDSIEGVRIIDITKTGVDLDFSGANIKLSAPAGPVVGKKVY